MKNKYIQINLALSPDLAEMFDELGREWGMKRPDILRRLVEPHYNRIIKKRAAVTAAVEVAYPEKPE